MGRWTHKHSEAIYGTGAGIPSGHFYGPTTLSADRQTLYLFVPHTSDKPVVVRGLKNHVNRIRIVGNGTKIKGQILGKQWELGAGHSLYRRAARRGRRDHDRDCPTAQGRSRPAPLIGDPKQMTTRILFVGNSFTARNSLPDLLSAAVEAGGKGALEWELVSAGGASLRQHFNKGDVAALLRDASWDAVVLQEQSTLPAKNAARMDDNVRDLDALIGQAGARTVLYMTWSRADAPETQTAISAAYAESGQQVGATVVPAGLAWQLCLRRNRRLSCTTETGAIPRCRQLPGGLRLLQGALCRARKENTHAGYRRARSGTTHPSGVRTAGR